MKSATLTGLLLVLCNCSGEREAPGKERILSVDQTDVQTENNSLKDSCDKVYVKYLGKSEGVLDADLRCQLEGKNLRDADLAGLNLQNAKMKDVILFAANLNGIDLSGADLRNADLRNLDMKMGNLRGANLTGAELTYSRLQGANLEGAILVNIGLLGTNLDGAYLYKATLKNACLLATSFKDARHWRLDFNDSCGKCKYASCARLQKCSEVCPEIVCSKIRSVRTTPTNCF